MSGAVAKESYYRPRPVSQDRPLDGSMHFTIMKHPKEALEIMNMLRLSGKLCDVTLKVNDDKLFAHKIVLAAASPYFKAMFTGGMKEELMSVIPIHGIAACVMSALINFAYTSEIHVKEMNVCSLLPAATMFQMSHVVEACCVFLEQQLDPTNCIGIADFANEHGCTDLHKKARDYIYQHFPLVSTSDEFYELSACQLVNLVNQDEIKVKCESQVYDAVIKWVGHDEDKRKNKLEPLLAAVRCHFLPPKFVDKQLKLCPLLKKNKQCFEYLTRIFEDLTLHKKVACERQRMSCTPSVIYVAGGYLRQSINNFECFNPKTWCWTKLAELNVPCSGLSACVLHGLFYTIGGRNNSPDGNVDSASLDVFDPILNKWRSCSPMSIPRSRVGVGVLDGLIYAVGGSQGSHQHSSAERYDPDADRWQSITSMSSRRLGVGVAVLSRLVYAVGGYDGHNRLNSVECYNPDLNTWHPVASMITTRSGAGICAMEPYIYAVGGYDNNSQLQSVERYNTETNIWEFIQPMNTPRSALSVAVLNRKLYAVGGYDGVDFLSSIECYDINTDEWTEITNMSCGRSGHGVAVGSEPCFKGMICQTTYDTSCAEVEATDEKS